MAGTSAVDSEYVIKLGRVRSVRAKPVNSPYWLVAAEAATPAIARLCATTIGSKNHDRFPIKRLPVVGSETLISSKKSFAPL